jgi:hypothetical protein
MEALIAHVVEGDSANHQLRISAIDQPGPGGAKHLYNIEGFNTESNASDPFTQRHGTPATYSTILFQNGPIKEVGVNGVTHEALLAIIIHRIEAFQRGEYSSQDNHMALFHLREALNCLQNRTRARIARGVEGTHTK